MGHAPSQLPRRPDKVAHRHGQLVERLQLLSRTVALAALAFGDLVYGLGSVSAGGTGGGADGGGGTPVSPVVPLVLGAVALAVFVDRQVRLARRGRALLDLRPFTIPQFRVPAVMAALVFMVLLGTSSLLVPLYLQLGLGASPVTAGLAVLPVGLLLAMLGRPVGRLFDRFGPRVLVPPGAVLVCAAMWALALIPAPALPAVIGLHLTLTAGLGLPPYRHALGVDEATAPGGGTGAQAS